MDLPLAAHLLVRTVGIHKAFVPFFCWEKLGGSTWFNQQNDLDSTATFADVINKTTI
jgi:hypothetical protein